MLFQMFDGDGTRFDTVIAMSAFVSIELIVKRGINCVFFSFFPLLSDSAILMTGEFSVASFCFH
jgi:hypothetical protein